MSLLNSVGWYGAGLAVWPFFEYAFHAWAMHNEDFRQDVYEAHQAHHHYPEYFDEFTTLWDSLGRTEDYVPEVAAAFIATLIPTLGIRRASALMAGLLTGFVVMENHHLELHKREPKNKWEERIWKNHFLHHFKNPKKNHGGIPLWDHLLGSYIDAEEVRIPADKTPPWLNEDRPGFKVVGKKRAA